MRKYYTDEPGIREIIEHYESATDAQLAAEDDAGARLALAAPDLLSARKAAPEMMTARTRPRAAVPDSRRLARTLRAAIRKAERADGTVLPQRRRAPVSRRHRVEA